jgi:peptide deformylase
MLELAPKEEVEGVTCEPVLASEVDEIMEKYVPDMIAILVETQGLGVAAPQVGIKKKFFVSKKSEGEGFDVYFNAFYTKEAERITVREGCLTYGKDNTTEVKRYKAIKFIHEEYDVEKKTLKKAFKKIRGSEAIVLQHEADHCGNGIDCKGVTIFMK